MHDGTATPTMMCRSRVGSAAFHAPPRAAPTSPPSPPRTRCGRPGRRRPRRRALRGRRSSRPSSCGARELRAVVPDRHEPMLRARQTAATSVRAMVISTRSISTSSIAPCRLRRSTAGAGTLRLRLHRVLVPFRCIDVASEIAFSRWTCNARSRGPRARFVRRLRRAAQDPALRACSLLLRPPCGHSRPGGGRGERGREIDAAEREAATERRAGISRWRFATPGGRGPGIVACVASVEPAKARSPRRSRPRWAFAHLSERRAAEDVLGIGAETVAHGGGIYAAEARAPSTRRCAPTPPADP